MGTVTDCLAPNQLAARGPWEGCDVGWLVAFEALARRKYGAALRHRSGHGRLTYEVSLPIIARDVDVDVRIEFYRDPGYNTYGLDPIDYPRVFADPGAASPHRMPDDSLCLYYPGDPESGRWTADDGLDELLNLTARHLFAEEFWRQDFKTWPFDEAPHGFRGAR